MTKFCDDHEWISVNFWDEYPECRCLDAMVNKNYFSNTDQKALDTASEIMQLLDKPMPYGQLKAKIQCILIELLEEKSK